MTLLSAFEDSPHITAKFILDVLSSGIENIPHSMPLGYALSAYNLYSRKLIESFSLQWLGIVGGVVSALIAGSFVLYWTLFSFVKFYLGTNNSIEITSVDEVAHKKLTLVINKIESYGLKAKILYNYPPNSKRARIRIVMLLPD